MLSRVSKGLTIGNGQNGQNGQNGSNGCHVNGDKGEFDDLISALRAGDVFGEDLVKMRRNRRRANGSPHRISQTSNSSVRDSRENSRERALNRKWKGAQYFSESRVLSLCNLYIYVFMQTANGRVKRGVSQHISPNINVDSYLIRRGCCYFCTCSASFDVAKLV